MDAYGWLIGLIVGGALAILIFPHTLQPWSGKGLVLKLFIVAFMLVGGIIGHLVERGLR